MLERQESGKAITEQDAFIRIRQTLSTIPYGGTAFHGVGSTDSLEAVADKLEKLHRVLAVVARQEQDRLEELEQYRAEHKALGSLLRRALDSAS